MTNELIAEKIMGLEFVQKIYDRDLNYLHHEWIDGISFIPTPDFLNDHNAAMMVVEKMREDGWCWMSGCSRTGEVYFEFWRDDVHEEFKVWSKSLCFSTCESALKAKGITP